MKKKTKVILGVVGVIAVGSVIAGNGDKENNAEKVGEVASTSSGTVAENTDERNTNVALTTGSIEATTETTTESSGEEVFEVGDIIETKNLKISYLSCGEYISDNQFIQPEAGNKFVFFELEFENISDSDESISSMVGFSCYADNNSCDQKFLIENDLSASLSPGRKTKGKVCFEVPENAQVIEVEYEENIFKSDRIVFLYS